MVINYWPFFFLSNEMESNNSVNNESARELEYVDPSARIETMKEFESKDGRKVKAFPIMVNFSRLLTTQRSQSKSKTATSSDINVVSTISNCDLLHAVVGLYSVSLLDMTPDALYGNVCDRLAKTVVLVRDLKETLEELEKRKNSFKTKHMSATTVDSGKESSNIHCTSEHAVNQDGKTPSHCSVREEKMSMTSDCNDIVMESETKSLTSFESKSQETPAHHSSDKDIYMSPECQPDYFQGVFSDTESESLEEETETEEEDYSEGVNTFIKNVEKRKLVQRHSSKQLQFFDVGPENRILACATFEKKFVHHNERIVHLTLLCVRHRYRKYGIGKYLLKHLVNPGVVGSYDAVVVHADHTAIEFFKQYGFSDNFILNSRWSVLAEQFTDCALLTYLPAFTGSSVLLPNTKKNNEYSGLDEEFNFWLDSSTAAYQRQISCMTKMKNEIIHLRHMVNHQHKLILQLNDENEELKIEQIKFGLMLKRKQQLEKDASCNLTEEFQTMDIQSETNITCRYNTQEGNVFTKIGDNTFITFCPVKSGAHLKSSDYIRIVSEFCDIIDEFKNEMKLASTSCFVNQINKASLPECFHVAFEACVRQLDLQSKTRAYFCGASKPEQLQEILTNGFSDKDFTVGEQGRGLYFSKNPLTASRFSLPGRLLLAEVGQGKTAAVLSNMKQLHKIDSLQISGNLHQQTPGMSSLNEEQFVILNCKQVLPMCVIDFSLVTSNT